MRLCAALLRRVGGRPPEGVPGLRRRDALPLPRVRRALQLGVRGRVRSLRRRASAADGVRQSDSPQPVSRTLAARFIVLTLTLLAAFAASAPASANDEQTLADRYSPVLRLVHQDEECGPGEPYLPLDVNALFGQPTVALRGPWNGIDLVKIAPTAATWPRASTSTTSTFPGTRSSPAATTSAGPGTSALGTSPSVYAHVASDPDHPGQAGPPVLALLRVQRLEQPARGRLGDDPARLRRGQRSRCARRQPATMGYSQHEGAEKADWGADKLDLVDGTHPVVYPAAGIARELLRRGLFLGSSAEQGVGCDNTTRPPRRPASEGGLDPERPCAGAARVPVDRVPGTLGRAAAAFFNGPTGRT